MKIRIGILEVGDRPKELQESHPSYADMTKEWLKAIDGDVTYYPITNGETLPSPSDADLWVITGSKCGVYEDHPWIPKLIDFIVAAKTAKVKMAGICFGHQIIAKALGGDVTKSDKGWGIGLMDYPLKEWPKALPTPPQALTINAYHQDQVITPPAQATVLAGSDFCPFAALWYPEFAVTFQGHPEFTNQYEGDLISLRSHLNMLDQSLSDNALASLQKESNRLLWGDWFTKNWKII